MSSERAGVHTSSALNREKARNVLRRLAPVTGSSRIDAYLDALEACVVPDARTITCARCGRTMLAAVGGNAPDNDAMEVCGLCWVDLSREQAHKLARIETEVYGTEKPQNLEAALHMVERVCVILQGDQ